MKPFYATILLLISSLIVEAQPKDFVFGKPSQAEYQLEKYAKDTSASAVVLREWGTAYISSSVGNNLIFKYRTRIKILNEKGFKHGNVSIPLRKNDKNTFEKVSDIQAMTIYPDEQGLYRSAALDPKQIFRENQNQYRDLVKFAMPSIGRGCIIEYEYTIESPFLFNFRTWNFQSDIPKVSSEFLARIPAVYDYNVSLRGPLKLTTNNAVLEKECFQPGGGFKADCSAITYGMADVPAFIEEDNMTARSNFLAALYFELANMTDYYGVKHKVTQDWKSIDTDLKRHDYFGAQLKRKDIFKDNVAPLITAHADPLARSKAVYRFIQSWYRWNGYYGMYSDEGIRKAYEKHSGSSADINLSLVAAMLAAGLDAEPVILSTRENGLINKLYPVVSDFNYVVCKVNIGDKFYLLDGTEPLLQFGLLPLRCINDQGRVMSLNKASTWLDMKASEKETNIYNLNMELHEDGKLRGKISLVSSGYAAFDKRQAIKKLSSVEEYIEKLDERMPRTRILSSSITNIDSLDLPVHESYEVEMEAFDGTDHDRLLFNPFFMDNVTENPFKLAERSYPVDLGAISETRVLMSLKIPEKFELVSKPNPVGLALPNKGGKFLMQVNHEGNSLSFYQLTQLDKAVYAPQEYPYLKELFNQIVQSQKADIILKKKI